MKTITVTDTTLKTLEGERLLFREKVAVAKKTDGFSVDRILLPEIKKPKEDTAIYRTVAKTVKTAALCLPVGNSKESIDTAWNAISEAVKPCLCVVLPVSTVTMEYALGLKAPALIEKIKELVSYAKEKCENVEFVASDASRADFDFLVTACKTAEECGATGVTVCDDAGIMLPDETEGLVMLLCGKVGVPVTVSVSDRLGLGLSCALSAMNAGADGLTMSVSGAGVLHTDAFADFISERGESIGIKTNLRTTEIHSDINGLLKGFSEDVDTNAVSGENSGLFDGNTEISVIRSSVESLGYELNDEDIGLVKNEIIRLCNKKGSVGLKELEAVIASVAMQVPSTYHLESYIVTSSNVVSAVSHVVLNCDDGTVDGSGVGDGPIDSAFKAIEQCTGSHYELDDFQIQSVTEGKEALGSALVRLRSNGRLYSGNGISTDIVGASIRAYLNALNKIVYEEKRS